MATWVPAMCQLLQCNTITFVHSSTFVVLFKNCIHLLNAWNMEHTKLMNPCLSSLYPSHYTDYFMIKDFVVTFWQLESWCFISSMYINTRAHTCSQNLIIFYWCVLCFVLLKTKFTNKWLQHGTAVLLLMQISMQRSGHIHYSIYNLLQHMVLWTCNMDTLKPKEMLNKIPTVTLKNHTNSKNLNAGFKHIHAKHKSEIGNMWDLKFSQQCYGRSSLVVRDAVLWASNFWSDCLHLQDQAVQAFSFNCLTVQMKVL